MTAEADETSGLAHVTDFLKGVLGRRTRAQTLRRLGSTVLPWFAAGSALTAVVAATQVHRVGLGPAWARFGDVWLLMPLGAAALPIAFVLVAAAIEAALFVVALLVSLLFYVPADFLLGEERVERLIEHLRKLPALGLAALLAWFAWASADQSVSPPTVPTPEPARESFSWIQAAYDWVLTNPVVTAVAGVLVLSFKDVLKSWGMRVLASFVDDEPPRVVPIYGPKGSVVSEVEIDEEPEERA